MTGGKASLDTVMFDLRVQARKGNSALTAKASSRWRASMLTAIGSGVARLRRDRRETRERGLRRGSEGRAAGYWHECLLERRVQAGETRGHRRSCSTASQRGRGQRPLRSRSPGCSPGSPGSCRFQEPRSCIAWRRISRRPPLNSARQTCATLKARHLKSTCKALVTPRARND